MVLDVFLMQLLLVSTLDEVSDLAWPPFVMVRTPLAFDNQSSMNGEFGVSMERRCTACVNCRRLKVKCEHSDPNDPNSPCIRCLKRKKECLFNNGKRKTRPADFDEPANQPAQQQDIYAPVNGPQAYRVYQLESIPRFQFTTAKINNIRNKLMSSWQDISDGEQRQNESIEMAQRYPFINNPADSLIAQGLLTVEECEKRIEIYKKDLYPVSPVVDIPDLPIQEFINQSPILFHVIMDVTAMLAREVGTWTAEIREHTLLIHNIVYQSVIYEAFVIGSKNLELIQSLLILLNWFSDPHFYHRKKIHLLFASLTALACDCGLGISRPAASNPDKARNYLDQIIQPHIIEENLSSDCALAWIGIYQFSFHHVSSFISRVTLEWSDYLDSCVNVVNSLSPNLQILVALANYCKLFEKITHELMRRNNQPTALDVDEPGVQYLISHFDKELEDLRTSTLARGTSHVEDLTYHSVKTYLHQVILYCPYNDKVGRASFTVYSLNFEREKLSAFAIKSFVTCYQSALNCIQTVLQCSPHDLLTLPIPALNNIFFCSAVVVKCRMLCMFNKHYYDACSVTDATMDIVADLTTFLDAVVANYSAAQTLATISFIIKVILCRTDAVIYSVLQEKDRANLDIQRFSANNSPHSGGTPQFSNVQGEHQAQQFSQSPKDEFPGPGRPIPALIPPAGINGTPPTQSPYPVKCEEPNATDPVIAPAVKLPETLLSAPVDNGTTSRRQSEAFNMNDLWNFAEDFLWKDIHPGADSGLSFDF